MQPPNTETPTVRKQIESDQFKLAVASVLPAHVTPARFVRISIAALTRVPKLSECDPNTVLQCLMQLSQFGLEPDGRNAHLIPFWNSKRNVTECQLIVDFKGLVVLAIRSGKVAFVHADKVCENDVFEWNKGQVVKHEINFKEDRGKPYAYYAIARMKDGTEQAEAMTMQEVIAIKNRSRSRDKQGNIVGPWITDFDEMSKKTVFRRLSKWLELSPEYRDALDVDADRIEDLRFDNALPIKRAVIPKLKDNLSAVPVPDGPPITVAQSVTGAGNPMEGEAREGASKAGESSSPTSTPVTSRGGAQKLRRKKQEVPPNQATMLLRLMGINKTQDNLMRVLHENEWIEASATWPLEEGKLAYFLEEENWRVVKAELEALHLGFL